MNWLFVIVFALLAVYGFCGYSRGILRMLYSLASLLLLVFFVAWSAPYISGYLMEHTEIYSEIQKICEETIQEKENQMPGGLPGGEMPGNADLLDALGVNQAVAEQVAHLAVDAMAYVAAFLVCVILLHFVAKALDVVSRIPILRGMNSMLGLVAGLSQGLVIVWIFFWVVDSVYPYLFGAPCMDMILSNWFLHVLYQHNLLTKVIAGIL